MNFVIGFALGAAFATVGICIILANDLEYFAVSQVFRVKARFDAAIVARPWGFGIRFAEIPDAEIAATITALTENNGILLDGGAWDSTGYPIPSSEVSPTHKEPFQRLYCWLKVSPVFDILGLARLLAGYLETNTILLSG